MCYTGSYVVQDIRVTQSFTNGTLCLKCVKLTKGMDRGCLIRMQQLDQCSCCRPRAFQLMSSPTTPPPTGFQTSVSGCIHHIYKGAYSLQVSDANNESSTISVQKMVSLKGLTCVHSPTSTSNNGNIRHMTVLGIDYSWYLMYVIAYLQVWLPLQLLFLANCPYKHLALATVRIIPSLSLSLLLTSCCVLHDI